MVEIVAEISGNHDGSLGKAQEMIRRAARSGCHYVKFQYYKPEDMPDRHEGNNEEMYKKLMVPPWWLPHLFKTAREETIVGLFASVFSPSGVADLLKFDTPFIKIASMDSTPLSKKTFMEIIHAVNHQRDIIYTANYNGTEPHGISPGLKLLCAPGHPPTNIWDTLRYFDPERHYGFSDHTAGIDTPLRFIRRGARMIEKHFKIDEDCVDKDFSADEDAMRVLCRLAKN